MKVLFVVDSMQRHMFFSRVAAALKSDHEFYFVSSEPLSILMALFNGFRGKHLSRRLRKNRVCGSSEAFDISKNSIEVLNGLFSVEEASRNVRAMADAICIYINNNKIDRVIIWNGQQLIGRTAKFVADKVGVQCQYLELANIPGKLFSDTEGVNALSSIAKNIEVIDRLPEVAEDVHFAWLNEYESEKSSPLPQAELKLKDGGLSFLNMILKVLLLSACTVPMGKRRFNFSARWKKSQECEHRYPREFIFLPLQVSSDTQIKLHSELNNIDAIAFSVRKAKEQGVELVVKIHPAETSVEEIVKVRKAQESLGFTISNANTIDLLKRSRFVITINSTVGLEALIYGKAVIILGKCFYQNFDASRIKKYIHHYLVDNIDYFGRRKIPVSAALKVLGI
ncbi:capsular biosynthesis protein [Pseudomonas sp. LPB0260]|uniref:capsular polysaccharide export protein, LipB/KpsS family n=1 Tax=Pseudomonas sp. LPB0260 TaxID=2614442 RepID=UPI0015C25B86|nr:capsular biosynthesis protein [Pseudomonas sp. LPB0260]QLC74727.1 capsular biosynthesis protein [Pseudomonas sp. LPB0260]